MFNTCMVDRTIISVDCGMSRARHWLELISPHALSAVQHCPSATLQVVTLKTVHFYV